MVKKNHNKLSRGTFLHLHWLHLLRDLLNSLSLLVAMKLISRFLLASAIVTAGALAYAPKTFAQAIVPFGGTVPGACTFGTPIAGTLSVNGANTTFNSAGGTAGSVSLSCTQAAQLTVGAPTYQTGPGFTFAAGDSAESTVTVTSGQVDNGTSTDDDGTPLALVVGANKSLAVNMSAANNGTLSAGVYSFNVLLTVTP